MFRQRFATPLVPDRVPEHAYPRGYALDLTALMRLPHLLPAESPKWSDQVAHKDSQQTSTTHRLYCQMQNIPPLPAPPAATNGRSRAQLAADRSDPSKQNFRISELQFHSFCTSAPFAIQFSSLRILCVLCVSAVVICRCTTEPPARRETDRHQVFNA